MKRRGWIIVGVLIVLIIIGAIVIPHFLNADTYRSRIESALSEQLGRPVTLGHLQFSLFTGSLVANNLSIADDPHYSAAPFLQASAVKIGVKVKPLIFDRELQITGLEVDSPRIALVRGANGVWNYSSLGNADKRKPGPQANSTLPNLSIGDIQIKNGSISMTDLPPQGKPRIITALNANIQRFSLTNWFPFSISAHLPTNASLSISGTAGPIDQKDASLTPLNAHVSVKNLDLVASGFVDAGQGIEGLIDLDTKALSNGHTLDANGTLQARNLQLSRSGSPSPQPVAAQFAIAQDLNALSGTIQHAVITVANASVQIAGTYKTAGANTNLNLHAVAQSVPIDQVEAVLPALGVKLPSGSRLEGGVITANLDITGTPENPTIHGPLSISNTQLAGFDLGSKLQSLMALTGQKTGAATVIRSLTTDLTDSPEGVRTDNLKLDVANLGTAAGSGTISPAGALNYHLIVKLAAAGVGGTVTQLASMIPGAGNLLGGAIRNGIPLEIGGTTSNPTFAPNLGGLTRGASPNRAVPGGQNPVGNVLGRLLGGGH